MPFAPRARQALEAQMGKLDLELHELNQALNSVETENTRLVERSKETQVSHVLREVYVVHRLGSVPKFWLLSRRIGNKCIVLVVAFP